MVAILIAAFCHTMILICGGNVNEMVNESGEKLKSGELQLNSQMNFK